MGPLCDKFGARILFAWVLSIAAIPTALTGLVNTSAGLSILRLFIGIAGGSFVMCQYWTSRMFTKDVVGTANALVAGWGNLGAGFTQLVMGAALFPLFKVFFSGDSEMAWRTVCVVPAVFAIAMGVTIYLISDDAPTGNYAELKKHGSMPEISAAASFRSGSTNLNTWLLFIQYACCFGVELTMNNAAALYFVDQFGQSTEDAAAIASIFGWMNIFSRGMGGFTSDFFNRKFGLRGRLWTQTTIMALEGAMVLIFANTSTLAGSIVVMVFFSIMVQAAAGSTFGLVPYVDPPSTGSIAGIVGAGGNTGAVCFGLAFRQLSYKQAFVIMGSIILCSAVCPAFICIKGHRNMFFGTDDVPPGKVNATLVVPGADEEKATDVNKDEDDDLKG
jgi:NNP family nitrate/nitrite transporter-like MFS transporter